MVVITGVEPRSLAQKAAIRAGDVLVSINGKPVADLLDYRFYLTEQTVRLSLERDGKAFEVTIRKEEYEDIGLEFESFLMDEKKRCSNACIFCFIDQNPQGMRESIYFKDDDTRLSFLHGSYVTLTNCRKEEMERIAAMHISPIRVSVHTTNPALRCQMLNNRHGGDVLERVNFLISSGIEVHCQIVLCRGVNDGKELNRTLDELLGLPTPPTSIAVVPAGLTRHREGLYPLSPYTPQECADIIGTVAEYQKKNLARFGTRLVWAADEFYTRGRISLPEDTDFYEDFPQLDNGVGLLASFAREVEEALCDCATDQKRTVSLATGEAAYDFMCAMVAKVREKCYNITCNVYAVKNRFYGDTVTVAGLLTGSDYLAALSGKELGEALYIPAVSLRFERDRFLDDMTPEELSGRLGVPIVPLENDGFSFVSSLTQD